MTYAEQTNLSIEKKTMDIKRRIAEFRVKYKDIFNEQIHKAVDETTQSRDTE